MTDVVFVIAAQDKRGEMVGGGDIGSLAIGDYGEIRQIAILIDCFCVGGVQYRPQARILGKLNAHMT